jgi:hypothetical protein
MVERRKHIRLGMAGRSAINLGAPDTAFTIVTDTGPVIVSAIVIAATASARIGCWSGLGWSARGRADAKPFLAHQSRPASAGRLKAPAIALCD